MPEWLEDGLVAHRGMAGKNLKHYRRLYKFAETMKMDKRLIRMISDVMKDVNRWMRTGDLVPPSELCLSPIEVFEKGRIGTVRLAKVQQVIDESNALVVIDVDKEDSDLTEERLVWLANISTANMVDDQPLLGFRAVVVSGTRQYGTVMGSTNTVPMLEPLGLQPYIEGLSELAFVDLVKKAGWTRKEFVLRIEKARVENPSGYLVDLADELEDRLLEASIQRTPVPIETKKAAVRQKT